MSAIHAAAPSRPGTDLDVLFEALEDGAQADFFRDALGLLVIQNTGPVRITEDCGDQPCAVFVATPGPAWSKSFRPDKGGPHGDALRAYLDRSGPARNDFLRERLEDSFAPGEYDRNYTDDRSGIVISLRYTGPRLDPADVPVDDTPLPAEYCRG